MRRAFVVACAVVAAGAIIVAVVIARGDGCDDLRFERPEWEKLDRREYASCVVEVQPFRGLDREALARRLGPPDERRRRLLVWLIGADELFGMKIDALVIPVNARGRAGLARIGRG